MKRNLMILLAGVCVACANDQLSHTETAELVAESFIKKDNESLKEYTTPGRYSSLVAVQDMIISTYSGESDFRVLQDTVYDDIAWVKFTTSHEQKPETFKLIKEDEKWKVTETGIRERGPF